MKAVVYFIHVAVIFTLFSGVAHAEQPEFRICDINRYDWCFEPISNADLEANRKYLSSPFVVLHPKRTKYVALLIHGLTDSPFYFKDIAKTLYRQGMNVIAIRLAGHGTVPEALQSVDVEDWRENVREGIAEAKKLGDHVIAGGFSTGGALSINAVANNWGVEGLMLLSPALRIANEWASLACYGAARFFKPWALGDEETVEDSPIRYRKMASKSVCELYRVTAMNGWVQGVGTPVDVDVPVFMAFSKADDQVAVQAYQWFAEKLNEKSGNRVVVYEELSHSSLPLRINHLPPYDFNPKFADMETNLIEFVQENFR